MTKGFYTSEFALSLIAVCLTALGSSGLLPEGSSAAKIVGLVSAMLIALGYTAGRNVMKLKMGAPEVKPAPSTQTTTAAIVIQFLVFVALSMQGCCFFRHDCATGVQSTLDCTVSSIQSQMGGVMAKVVSALAGDSPEAALYDLATQAGVDLIDCAVHAAIEQLNLHPLGAGASPEEAALRTKMVKAGQHHLASLKRPIKAP